MTKEVKWKDGEGKDSFILLRIHKHRGAWVAQSVRHPTLEFCSGCDLMVHGMEPRGMFELSGGTKPHVWLCTNSVELAWDALFPLCSSPAGEQSTFSLSLSLPLSLSLSKINKTKQNNTQIHKQRELMKGF